MVQAGDKIARRFIVVRSEEADLPGVERYLARDTRLDSDVTLDIVTALAPSAVIRAAHRSRVLRDKRLQRVVAAGVSRRGDDRVSYVVTERPRGVRLDGLLGKTAFAPACAAAVVGEAATALAAVLGAGVHHGMVRAAAITVTPKGRVVLSGMGIDGELAAQAGLPKGRTERADAIALAGIYLTALTAKAPADATIADLPDDVPVVARRLCEQVIKGSGPKTLAEVIAALGTGDRHVLRVMVAEAPTLWWSAAAGGLAIDTAPVDGEVVDAAPTETVLADDAAGDVVDGADDAAIVDDAAVVADAADLATDLSGPGAGTGEDTDADPTAMGEELGVTAEPEAPPARPRTRFGGAVDDIDEFHDIVDAQNAVPAPSVAEAVFERLHQRFPASAPLANAAAAAHRRAQASAPLNAGPLLLALLIVTVFVATIVAASLLTAPYVPDFDGQNNPPQTYPEYTIGQTPTPTP